MKKQLLVATLIMAICAPSWADPGVKTQEIIDNQGRKAKVEVKKNKDGKHEAIVTPEGCSDQISCQQVVLLKDDQINNFKDIEIAIRKDAEDKRLKAEADKSKDDVRTTARRVDRDERKSSRRERSNDSTLKDYKEEIRDELADILSTECDIETDSSLLTREERRARAERNSVTSLSATSLAGTRWASLELPQSNEKARCASEAVQEFMLDYEEELSESLDKDDLKDMREEIADLKRELRRTDDDAEKQRIKEELEKKEQEYASVKKESDAIKAKMKIANDETTRVFKSHILKPAILDAANSGDAHGSLLYRLATDSPEMFSGVRKASSEALLHVYKLQAQSQLALKDAAAKTNDPALKLQYSQEALAYNTMGLHYNRNMMDPHLRQMTREKAYSDYLLSNAINPASPSVAEVQAAQNYANGVLKDIYGTYDAGASQITTYLNTIAGSNGVNRPNQAQTLPSILSDYGISDKIHVGGPSVSTGSVMRGGTTRIGATANGAAPAPRPARTGIRQ